MAGTLSSFHCSYGLRGASRVAMRARRSRKFATSNKWEIHLTRLDRVLPKTANVIRLPPVGMHHELLQRITKHYRNVRQAPPLEPWGLVPTLCGSGRNESLSPSACSTGELHKNCANRTGVSSASLHHHLPGHMRGAETLTKPQ